MIPTTTQYVVLNPPPPEAPPPDPPPPYCPRNAKSDANTSPHLAQPWDALMAGTTHEA
jgi:hypothetical protein